MSAIVYRGKTTRTLYTWGGPSLLPSSLTDNLGNPLQFGPFNGETVVLANRDGSVARGTAGGPVPGDPYSSGYVPSPWESLPG